MPQHEVGYRAWNGKRTSQISRWWIIAETGFQAALKSAWVRRILFVAWLPIFYWGTTLFVLENVLSPPEPAKRIVDQVVIDDLLGEEGQGAFSKVIDQQKVQRFKRRFEEINQRMNSEFRNNLPPNQRRAVDSSHEKEVDRLIDEFNDFKRHADELAVQQLGPIDDEVNEIQQEISRRIRNREIARRFGWVPGADKFLVTLESGTKEEQRHVAWSLLLMTFFRYPQATMIIFLLGIISPGLVSRDLRSRAYLIYFSKPIGRLEYICGKLAIPSVFLILVTTLPALCLYALGVSLSPELSVVFSTWDIPIRILLASVVLIIPTACLSLMLSSLTSESRFATFAWFAVWILGHGAWMGIWMMQAIRSNGNPLEALDDGVVSFWSPLSLYNNLGVVQSWIFGMSDFSEALPGLGVLIFLMVFSIAVLFRKVSAPVRV